VVRPGNVYGPAQDPHGEAGVVAIFAGRMLRGEPVTIFGDGSQLRDYVYVADVVEAAALAATQQPDTCLLGTGTGTSTRRIFELTAAAADYERPPVYGPDRPGDISQIALDATKAQRVWGWEPRVALADGLATTVEWFRQQRSA
jgi:UDP-glucose 4-epimerase